MSEIIRYPGEPEDDESGWGNLPARREEKPLNPNNAEFWEVVGKFLRKQEPPAPNVPERGKINRRFAEEMYWRQFCAVCGARVERGRWDECGNHGTICMQCQVYLYIIEESSRIYEPDICAFGCKLCGQKVAERPVWW